MMARHPYTLGLLAVLAGCGARSELVLAPAAGADAARDGDGAIASATRCERMHTPAACFRDARCTWVVAGCGDPVPSRVACVPRGPCATDGDCEPGERCVVFDTCGGTPCTICPPGSPSSRSRVCLP